MSPSNTIPAWQEMTCEQLLGPLNRVETKRAPEKLFVAGDPKLLRSAPRVAVVGTRNPSPGGVHSATQFARELVRRGVTVVSGLAEGIDTAAHTEALAAGGRTIAVLGTPLDKFYPSDNRKLQLEIMRNHLAISQFPIGSKIFPGAFPIRNRTMALISHATIIVEAYGQSGTIHQGWEALRLGRPLLIAEELMEAANLPWVEEMEEYGATLISPKTLDLIFEYIPVAVNDSVSPTAF
jgi:DNA processing protein